VCACVEMQLLMSMYAIQYSEKTVCCNGLKTTIRIHGGEEVHRLGQVAGTCDCGNETSVSIKCGEFLD